MRQEQKRRFLVGVDPGDQNDSVVRQREETFDPTQVGMFDEDDPPPPPTGPLADPYHNSDNRPEKFIAFMESDNGKTFMARAAGAALAALRQGDARFSVLGYIHTYRAIHNERVNNTFAPWVADELVARHPRLVDLIERRKRRKAGPQIQSTTTEKENT